MNHERVQHVGGRLVRAAACSAFGLAIAATSGVAFGQVKEADYDASWTNPVLDEYPTDAVNRSGLAVEDNYVTVGQLHSVTGTMAISETGSVEAERLAITQINEMGGVLGRQVKVIFEDGASDWPTFAEKAKKLLINDKVGTVFGCWTSASRKAVLPIFEKENGMLY
ncbi:MAG: transporter substrate-binding protein, partial [Planctomycetota bacterium]